MKTVVLSLIVSPSFAKTCKSRLALRRNLNGGRWSRESEIRPGRTKQFKLFGKKLAQ